MFSRLLLLFILVPLGEMMLLVYVSKFIGLQGTLLLIVLTGIIGASLARAQGLGVYRKIQESMSSGIPPTQTLIEGLLVLIGGVVLLTPGIITDFIGFSLMIPPIRSSIGKLLIHKFAASLKTKSTFQFSTFTQQNSKPPPNNNNDDVIDV